MILLFIHFSQNPFHLYYLFIQFQVLLICYLFKLYKIPFYYDTTLW